MPKNKEKITDQTAAATTSSNWDDSVRTVTDLASRAALPATPPMPNGWNDEELYKGKEDKAEFTAGELGMPEEDDEDEDARDGKGPLQQEGEGNRQNSQLAELEQDIDAKADLERRR